MSTSVFSKQRFWMAPLLLILSIACLGGKAPTPEPITDQETELGMEIYNELKDDGKIVEDSPLYDTLRPIAEALARAAQPHYPHPLKLYVIREDHPNAASTPGGNIYVVESLLTFVKNTEELAGTLCHEISHTIHRDSVEQMKRESEVFRRQLAAAILLGPTAARVLAIAIIGKMDQLHYSRDVESRADVDGADLCGAAGYNPWGLVWLFQDFKSANPDELPEMLSNHPDYDSRIRTLKRHFQDNPAVFGRFDPDQRSAHALNVPKNAPASSPLPTGPKEVRPGADHSPAGCSSLNRC